MDIKQTIKDAVAEAFAPFHRNDDDETETEKAAATPPSAAPAPHPVLAVVLQAGIDTPEKFATLQGDLSTAQSEVTRLGALETRVLGDARKEATAAAVRAYADKPEKLEKAKKAIEFASDLDDLQSMKSVYEEQTPDVFKPKETQPERQVTGTEQLATTPDDAALWNSIRANPTAANPVPATPAK
jgi:hypothetical protein